MNTNIIRFWIIEIISYISVDNLIIVLVWLDFSLARVYLDVWREGLLCTTSVQAHIKTHFRSSLYVEMELVWCDKGILDTHGVKKGLFFKFYFLIIQDFTQTLLFLTGLP